MVNRESSWCQRFHGFATKLHDWLRPLANSREYSYGVSTNKHDSATVALDSIGPENAHMKPDLGVLSHH